MVDFSGRIFIVRQVAIGFWRALLAGVGLLFFLFAVWSISY